MGKIERLKKKIAKLEQDLADIDMMLPPGVGTDLNEGRADKIKLRIQQLEDMIAQYDGDE